MNTAKASGQSSESRPCELDRRYGRIGISALLAALPYRSETKNQVPAQAEKHD